MTVFDNPEIIPMNVSILPDTGVHFPFTFLGGPLRFVFMAACFPVVVCCIVHDFYGVYFHNSFLSARRRLFATAAETQLGIVINFGIPSASGTWFIIPRPMRSPFPFLYDRRCDVWFDFPEIAVGSRRDVSIVIIQNFFCELINIFHFLASWLMGFMFPLALIYDPIVWFVKKNDCK